MLCYPKFFLGGSLQSPIFPESADDASTAFAVCLASEPGTFQSESLGSALLIQKFRLCDAAL